MTTTFLKASELSQDPSVHQPDPRRPGATIVVCDHADIQPGPREDRETCVRCLSSWPRGQVTGPRERDKETQELVKQRLAEIDRAHRFERDAEVNRRVEAELAQRAKDAKHAAADAGGKK